MNSSIAGPLTPTPAQTGTPFQTIHQPSFRGRSGLFETQFTVRMLSKHELFELLLFSECQNIRSGLHRS